MLELFRFLDWLLALPPPLEEVFGERHTQLEKERNMAYKMQFELDAEARGLEKGRRAALLAVLEARFAPLPPGVTSRLDAITGVERLDRLVRQAAVATALEDVLSEVDSTSSDSRSPDLERE